MAILKRLYRTKTTKRHKDYQRYVKQEKIKKRKPMSFRMWQGKDLSAATKKRAVPKKLQRKKAKETAASLLVDYARGSR